MELFQRNVNELDIFEEGFGPGEDERVVMDQMKSVKGMTKH